METIVVLKRDIKFYYFTNYLIKNSPIRTIDVVLNNMVHEDIGDIIETSVNRLLWGASFIKYSDLTEVEDGLYLSNGLTKFTEVFKNDELLLNFHKYIVVEDFKKITHRISSV